MKRALATLSIIVLMLLPAAAEGNPYISVSGYAEVPVTPDMATFSVSASFTRETTEEARKLASGMIADAIRILDGYGINKEDITTTALSVYPEYSWKDGEQVLTGQRATQSINVKCRDISAIGEIYDSLSQLSGISFSSVTLDKADKSAEIAQARTNAVLDARTKADTYADAAGVEVGKVLSISDASSGIAAYRSSNMKMMAEAVGSSTEYYSGDITISASVSIVYSII